MITTLQASIYGQFPSNKECLELLESLRWRGNPQCPYCHSAKKSRANGAARYHCNGCNVSYSVTVGTLFQKSRLDLRKWFVVVALIAETGKLPSARRLADMIEVNKNTACYLAMRIRLASQVDRRLLQKIADHITEVNQ